MAVVTESVTGGPEVVCGDWKSRPWCPEIVMEAQKWPLVTKSDDTGDQKWSEGTRSGLW